jgi:hypothetical protein
MKTTLDRSVPEQQTAYLANEATRQKQTAEWVPSPSPDFGLDDECD